MGLQILNPMKKYFILGFLPLLFACETVIDYEGELSEPQIVSAPIQIASTRPRYEGRYGFSPSSNLTEIGLTYSVDILDNGYPQPLDNALVQMREQGGTWVDFDEVIDGYYTSNSISFEEGKTYEYRASRSGYDEVSTGFSIPTAVVIDDVQFVKTVPSDSMTFEDGYSEYDITFTDPGGTQYYSISCYLVDANDTVVGSYYVTSNSPYANAISDGDFYYFYPELFTENALYEGDEITIPIRIQDLVFENPPQGLKLGFVLRTHDVHSYRYHSSLQRYRNSGGSGDPFSQPVLVYTNFEKGLGYMGGFSVDLWVE